MLTLIDAHRLGRDDRQVGLFDGPRELGNVISEMCPWPASTCITAWPHWSSCLLLLAQYRR